MTFKEIVDARRSVRAYDAEKPVPGALIDEMIYAAQAAPSAGNRQPWHFYAIKNRETIRALQENAYKQAFMLAAPLMIVVCADAERCAKTYGDRGRTLYCLQDTAAAVENILLCAAANGLGACWCGAFDEDDVRKTLSLPAHLRPVALIPIGYPAGDTPKRPRRPIEEIVTVVE